MDGYHNGDWDFILYARQNSRRSRYDGTGGLKSALCI